MFPTIASCSTLRIWPYLFYIEKFIIQFKTTEKHRRSSNPFFQRNDFLRLWRGPAVKKKPPFSNVRGPITCEIVRSRECAVQYWGMTSPFAHLKKVKLKIFNFAAYNPCQSSPSLTISVPLWFIIMSSVFFSSKLLLRGPGLRTLYK